MSAQLALQQAPPRMSPLARLPIFLDLEGKRVVLAGNGAGVAWKAELLSAAGASISAFACNPDEGLLAVAAQAPLGPIVVHARDWRAGDIAGAALVVGGFDDEEEASRFASAARLLGVPVNVIDKPAFCDFSFGAIVNRSPLVIGICTAGAAPAFAQAIRGKLETLIPRGFALWADAARRWRSAVQASGLAFSARRKFWQLFAGHALARPDDMPRESDFEAILERMPVEASAAELGRVTLLDVGHGEAELLSLRAVRALVCADVILMRDAVSPAIVDFARREARMMLLAYDSGETIALVLKLVRSGRHIIHLVSGPSMQEEITACHAAGIPVEIIPGISFPPPACSGSEGARNGGADNSVGSMAHTQL